MPRQPRWMLLAQDAAYHVMSRGHNREAIFADSDDLRYFLALLARYRERFGFRLYHYCILANHFHLLLQPEDPRHLSRLMAGLLVAYARSLNRRHGFVGHLFQGRFKSPVVQREGYWLSCGRYIERNRSRRAYARHLGSTLGRAAGLTPWARLTRWYRKTPATQN